MTPLPFLPRLWFSFAAFFRVLFDGEFAAWVQRGPVSAEPALPAKEEPAKLPAKIEPPPPPREDAALQLLALLQREGRFVDFLEEDIAGAADADIGAAARVVHGGCRKALREHLTIEPVRAEDEGAKVTIDAGFDPASLKLTGNVQGSGPHSGTLRHRGWRAASITLPKPIAGHDVAVLAQAEVEL